MQLSAITLSVTVSHRDDRTNLVIARSELSRLFGWEVAKRYVVNEFKAMRSEHGRTVYRVRVG